MTKQTLKSKVYEVKHTDWNGYNIRFVEYDGEWMAVLKDITDALGLRTAKLRERLHPNMMERVKIKVSEVPNKDLRSKGDNQHRWMIIINEGGIYQALFTSRKLEAQKFAMWTTDVLKKLRKHVGLEGYEVFRMTEPEIQDEIDWILDSIYYDEETGKVMKSVTLPGGDVDQVEL